ncbi:MAG TPA: flavoprotein, partial [Candidatus Avimonas sp.]|nr:flavoprotein [Candidatus Avimonas sp.]
MNSLKIGFVITGSFCTFDRILTVIQKLKDEGADITPILSYNASTIDTRFGRAEDLHKKLIDITGKKPLDTLVEVEPIGPKDLVDVLVVAPCTGSTLGRLANGIS